MNDNESRSVQELLLAATDWTINDGEGDWTAVVALHVIGTEEVLQAALTLTKSADAKERARAADILGQLGVPNRTFPEACLGAVMALLNADSEPNVLRAAATALGYLKDERGSGVLAALVDHPDSGVRYAVAFALGGRSDAKAIGALIRLSDDKDEAVRDWATFGLGAIGHLDTPAIREALFHRLNDEDATTRYEAMCGLARCGDIRVVDPLIVAIVAGLNQTEIWIPAVNILKGDDQDFDLSPEALVARLRSQQP